MAPAVKKMQAKAGRKPRWPREALQLGRGVKSAVTRLSASGRLPNRRGGLASLTNVYFSICRAFVTDRTPLTWRVISSARARSATVGTIPVRETVPSAVATLTRVRLEARSAASLAFTWVLISAIAVQASQPARLVAWDQPVSSGPHTRTSPAITRTPTPSLPRRPPRPSPGTRHLRARTTSRIITATSPHRPASALWPCFPARGPAARRPPMTVRECSSARGLTITSLPAIPTTQLV